MISYYATNLVCGYIDNVYFLKRFEGMLLIRRHLPNDLSSNFITKLYYINFCRYHRSC